ncbi:hypothetical protein [Flavobacterium sp. I3-2]|uniref:hypothetical protein n=1 Tax=Flavobacterium sp. I3-2 TaxID=2748319 RepID=UPI0015AF5D18|nr:hypothetical protein [Flavobacterium sp. I3-2]
MKKDIEIPKSENVFIAAINEWNDDFQENTWYAYLVNENDKPLEMAIINSRAYGLIDGEQRKTGTFRHVFAEVPANGAIKVELLENNVLQLNNEFVVTYYLNGIMYDKTFVFRTNTINTKATSDILSIDRKGVVVK